MVYCTLYGDMNGSLAVIGDLDKTTVLGLCDWIDGNATSACGSALDMPSQGELIGVAIEAPPQ